MALGTMSVLGISSNLSWDNIEQLKENEQKNRVEPITEKIETNMEKQTELASLMTMMTSLNTNFKNLSDFSTYQKREATVEGDGVKATAGEGLALQDIKINVSQLAQNDVNQVGMKFASRDSVFTNKNTSIDFYYNGTNYSIDVKAGATVAEVAQSITDATDGAVMGIVMKTGGENPYQLMINSKDTGKNNKVYFGSTLESAAMPGGHIKSGTLDIEIAGEKISVDMSQVSGLALGNDSAANAKAILEEVKKQAESNANLKAKLDNGEIMIDLNTTGKGLMINDSTGGEIKVTTTDIKMQAAAGVSDTDTDLGFVKKSTGGSSNGDLITGNAIKNNANISGTILVNGTKVDLSGSTSAQDVADKINAQFTNGDVVASVKDGKLVMNSSQDIVISAEGADDTARKQILDNIGLSAGTFSSAQSFLKEMNITNIQKAQNAEFTYNGIQIERDKNNINDVVSGLTLELTAVTEANKDVTVRVARDDEGLAEEMEEFVKNYNEVYNKVTELLKYDEDTEVTGVFNGNSDIRSITRQLNSIILSNDVNGNNLVKYGVYMNDDGTLKFEKEKFEEAYEDDPDAAVSFFRSTTSNVGGESEEIDGVFTKLRNTMDSLITGDKATLKILETSLSDEKKTLEEDKTSEQESIDARYNIMAEKWSAYDQMIAKTQQSANTITQLINQASQ